MSETTLTSKQLMPVHVCLSTVASGAVDLQGPDAREFRKDVAATLVRLSPDITLDQFDMIRTDILDIANTLAIFGDGNASELHGIAIQAYDLACELLYDYDGCDKIVPSKVHEVYINFERGLGEIICKDCSADDVADALERIARDLRLVSDTPGTIYFDEGKISIT